jgi:hypothetical protein
VSGYGDRDQGSRTIARLTRAIVLLTIALVLLTTVLVVLTVTGSPARSPGVAPSHEPRSTATRPTPDKSGDTNRSPPTVAVSSVVRETLDLIQWLRHECAEFRFDVGGVFQRTSDHSWWPLKATDAAELESRLEQGGHLLPLPREPAALANVLEVSLVNFLLERAERLDDAYILRGTERGYPDLELGGAPFGGGFHAVDIKAARRAKNRHQTQSRITLYTGNTYFKWPDLHWPGTIRSFNGYQSHLDVILIYTLNPDTNARVEDLEIIVQEPWRIASKERSSTTREYIGAVMEIDDLRNGRGVFSSPDEFYETWRKFPFKVSPQVHRQLERLLRAQAQELTELRRIHGQPGNT